ncbi:hypothetical protein KFE98_10810 [bacterium SCSIO 12741]|nr:hypothetical protein KFE98_10810 [bacterium SCSIO 12741]
MGEIRKITLPSLIFLLILLGCNKQDDIYTAIPDVPVNVQLNLNEPSNFNLTVVGGWVYVNGGSRGIIVYRTIDDFVAFERHTPYMSDQDCAQVSVDSTATYANDGCSESQFFLVDGSVVRGPAQLPLKRYQTSHTADILVIRNN